MIVQIGIAALAAAFAAVAIEHMRNFAGCGHDGSHSIFSARLYGRLANAIRR
jgi:hypothetical protein